MSKWLIVYLRCYYRIQTTNKWCAAGAIDTNVIIPTCHTDVARASHIIILILYIIYQYYTCVLYYRPLQNFYYRHQNTTEFKRNNFKLNNCSCSVINKTENIKYLGITIYQHLKWDAHIKIQWLNNLNFTIIVYEFKKILNI